MVGQEVRHWEMKLNFITTSSVCNQLHGVSDSITLFAVFEGKKLKFYLKTCEDKDSQR